MSYDSTDHGAGVATVDQALVFLGVEESTTDDFIITMYTAKVRLDLTLAADGFFVQMLSQVTTWTSG